MSSFFQQPLHDSDDDDDDYVPTAEADSDHEVNSHDEGPGFSDENLIEDEEAKKKAREALWADFQASVATPPPSKPTEPQKNLIKVEKRYLFAGEEVVEFVEVAEDSADAQKWPLCRPPEASNQEATAQLRGSKSTTGTLPISTSISRPPQPQPRNEKRLGPRKPKTTLSALPQKAMKISTLHKSAMDWNAHINAQTESSVRDELEANRRGGGYLEKVEFLRRVDERKEDVIEANKPTKRRKL